METTTSRANLNRVDEFKLEAALPQLPSLRTTRLPHHIHHMGSRHQGHGLPDMLVGPEAHLSSPGVDLALIFPDTSMIGTAAAASNDPFFHQIFGRGGDGMMAPSPTHLTMPLSALASSRQRAAVFGPNFVQETMMQQPQRPRSIDLADQQQQQQPSLEQVNAARHFIQQVEELKKRAHVLWEAENYELDRGASLRILGGSGAGTGKPSTAPKAPAQGIDASVLMPPPPPQLPRFISATPTAGMQPMSATATEGLVGAASPSQSDLLGFISLNGLNNSPSCLNFDMVHAEVRLLGGTPTKAAIARMGERMDIEGLRQGL